MHALVLSLITLTAGSSNQSRSAAVDGLPVGWNRWEGLGERGHVVVSLPLLAFILLVSSSSLLASRLLLLVLEGLVEVAAGAPALLDDVASPFALEAEGGSVARFWVVGSGISQAPGADAIGYLGHRPLDVGGDQQRHGHQLPPPGRC